MDKLKALVDKVNAGISAFWAKLNSNIGDLWNESKLFLLVFGVIIVVIKFRQLLIDLIVSNSKTLFDNATKESDASQKKENEENDAANQLVKHAQELPDSEGPIGDDWNTKK